MQKKYRLKKSFQYNYIYRKGRSITGKEMTLYYATNKNGRLQIGVSVSKKIGKAHMRNRIRRLFKECARSLIPQIDNHYNYIMLARVDACSATYSEIKETLENLLKQVGCLKKSEISNTSIN